jgi:DNA-directed RNA polymerase specialized sigma24 family protein
MIENYLSFDITRFVADCFEHKKALPSLRLQLADLDGIKAIDPTRDKVQSSPSNDGMVNLAMLRLKLSAQIEDYERDLEKLEKALQVLTSEEREAIDICFNGESIQDQCLDLNIEERTIYNRRKKALSKLNSALIG